VFISYLKVKLFLSGDLYNDHCNILLPVAEKERLGISTEVCLYMQTLLETFHLYSSSLVLYLSISTAALLKLKLLRLDISDQENF
jgi:hypothetical protein